MKSAGGARFRVAVSLLAVLSAGTPSPAESNGVERKLLVVGPPDLLAAAAPGWTAISLAQRPQFAPLLEGDAEEPLLAALEREGIGALLVDSRRAGRDRPGALSVRARMASGWPLDRASALVLDDGSALYSWREPLALGEPEAAELIRIARRVLRGEDATGPVPDLLAAPRPSEVGLLLRRDGRAVLALSATGSSLADAAKTAAARAAAAWPRGRAGDPPLVSALESLTVEIDVFHDYGTLIGRSRDFLERVLEPGVHGVVLEVLGKRSCVLPSQGIEVSRPSRETLLGELAGSAGLSQDAWKHEGATLTRFRTLKFRELRSGGAVVRLARAGPLIGPDAVSPQGLLANLRLASDWLVANQQPDGRFLYRYHPESDGRGSAYNVVRHALAAHALLLAHGADGRSSTLEAARRALRLVFEHTRFGEGPPGPDGRTGAATEWRGKPIPRDMAFVRFADLEDKGPVAKAGATAAAILALTEGAAPAAEADEDRHLRGYGEFLLFLQKPDGSFWHYYVTPDHPYYGAETTIYPGEILFGLSRVLRATGDRRYAESFDRGMAFYRGWWKEAVRKREADGAYPEPLRLDLVQFVPWIAAAMNDRVAAQPEAERSRACAEFGVEVSEWVVNEYQYTEETSPFPDYVGGYFKVPGELPAMHAVVYTEGTAAAFNLARWLGDSVRAEKLQRATLLGCRFAVELMVRPGENDFWLPNPLRARGGVRYALDQSRMRIDYNAHAVSAFAQALKYGVLAVPGQAGGE